MDDLAEQIVEHFPTEDKVLSKNTEILKGDKFFKVLFSNSRRNPGIIMMVPTHAVAFFSVVVTHVETSKPTTHPPQNLSLTLPQARMKTPRYLMQSIRDLMKMMMKRNL